MKISSDILYFNRFHKCLSNITAAQWICSEVLNHSSSRINLKPSGSVLEESVAPLTQTADTHFCAKQFCCLHRNATQKSKGADKGSTNQSSASTCHLLNWHVKGTWVEQVDMATHGSDASETMYRRVSRYSEQQTKPTYCLICLTTKKGSGGLRASFPDNFVNSRGHLGTENWSLWILMRDLRVRMLTVGRYGCGFNGFNG